MEFDMEIKQKEYLEQGMDLKRLVLVLGKKLWFVVIAAVFGAILGGLTYKVVTNIIDGEPEYRASADYYITFFGEGAHYFNAYTWDGILRDDPIVDYALTLLPTDLTKEMVKNAVSGEMLGDYRILTVHVNANTKELAEIAKKNCEEVYCIQTVDDLKNIEITNFGKIGIMAGASTPKEVIEEVKKYIENYN